jgi:ABC-type multidrug transport system ATPase subunit
MRQVGKEAVLKFESVSKAYKVTSGRQEALSGVSFVVPSGNAHLLVGPNGSGKSTCIRLAAGLLVPDSGSVYLSENRRVGLAFEGGKYLEPRLTTRENMWYFGSLGLQPRRMLRDGIPELLAQFGLADLADRQSQQLSQGQRQKLAICLALIGEPLLLLLDEPTQALDREGVNQLCGALEAACMRGCAVVASTHDTEFARRLGGTVTYLKGGNVIAEQAPSNGLNATAVEVEYESELDGEMRSQLNSLLGADAFIESNRVIFPVHLLYRGLEITKPTLIRRIWTQQHSA